MLIPTVSINTHTEQSRLSFIVSWFDDAPFVSNGAPNKANYPVVSALCVQCVPQPLAERFSIAHNSCALEKATGCSAIIPSGKTISTSIPLQKKSPVSNESSIWKLWPVVQYLYQRGKEPNMKQAFLWLNLILSIRWLCVCVRSLGERSRRLLKQSARTTSRRRRNAERFRIKETNIERKVTIKIWERERGCIRCVYSIHDEIDEKKQNKREWRKEGEYNCQRNIRNWSASRVRNY